MTYAIIRFNEAEGLDGLLFYDPRPTPAGYKGTKML
jgi:hypothetical protein